MQTLKENAITKQSLVSIHLINFKKTEIKLGTSEIPNRLVFDNDNDNDILKNGDEQKPQKGVSKTIVALSRNVPVKTGKLTIDAMDSLVYINSIFEDGFNVVNYFTEEEYWLPKSYFKGIVVAVATNSNIKYYDNYQHIPLPIFSKAFTQKYIHLYNHGNDFHEAFIKMYKHDDEWYIYTDKNNIVTMSPLRNLFTREDVLNLFSQYEAELNKRDEYDAKPSPLHWAKENLDKL